MKKENPAKPEGELGRKMLDRMNKSHAPLREWGLSLCSYKERMHILDVGCGGGATIKDLLSLSDDSIVEGIDYSEESVYKSSLFNQELLGERVFIQQADVVNLPFNPQTFDLVTAVETVYFWPDIIEGFKEIKRVLKEDGALLILCEGSNPDREDLPQLESFFRIYRPEELVSLLEEAGFKAVGFERGKGEYIGVLTRL